MDVHDVTTLSPQTIERFWSRVDQSGGPDVCWPWTAMRDKDGYGRVKVQGGTMRAHRLARSLTDGRVPHGLLVLHACDNPPCCNPAHLRAGTDLDNKADMVARGRQTSGDLVPPENRVRGDRHWARLHPERLARGDKSGARLHPETRARGSKSGMARLTESDIPVIFAKFAAGLSKTNIARMYGVGTSTIGSVLSRETWRHVPVPNHDLTTLCHGDRK